MNNIQQYAQYALALVGTLYAVASLAGNLFPNTKFGKLCLKFAADLSTVKKLEEGLQKTGALAGTPAPGTPPSTPELPPPPPGPVA